MAFLTISDGITTLTLDVDTDGARESEPDRIGSTERAMSGRWRSSVAQEFRNFTFVVPQLAETDYQTLRALVARDRLRTVAGDAIGSSITARVRLTDAPFTSDIGLGGYFTRSVTVTVSEG